MGVKLGNNEAFAALADRLPDGIELGVVVTQLKTRAVRVVECRAAGTLLHSTVWNDHETPDDAARRLTAALKRRAIL